jgi:hypothetical protein
VELFPLEEGTACSAFMRDPFCFRVSAENPAEAGRIPGRPRFPVPGSIFSGVPGPGTLLYLKVTRGCVWTDLHWTDGIFIADDLTLLDSWCDGCFPFIIP